METTTPDYLEAKIDGNRELSDAKFEAQATAVNAALVAAEKAVNAALAASEKAVAKAELAQTRVNESQNEFRGTLRDQAATLMPRSETELLLREIRTSVDSTIDQIGSLRSRIDIGPPSLGVLQARSDEAAGVKSAHVESKQDNRWAIGIAMSVPSLLLALIALALYIAK